MRLITAADEWAVCPECSADVLCVDLCEHDEPLCVDRCCEKSHPVGRKPWEVAA